MKKYILLILIFSTLNIYSQEIKWFTDVDKAIEKSIETKKPMMLFFTGKDWCPPCKMTHKYIFKSKEFLKWSKKVILVELDFPKGAKRAKIPKQYSIIARDLNVRSYPTVWFIETDVKDRKPALTALQPPIIGAETNPLNWIKKANQILTNKK